MNPENNPENNSQNIGDANQPPVPVTNNPVPQTLEQSVTPAPVSNQEKLLDEVPLATDDEPLVEENPIFAKQVNFNRKEEPVKTEEPVVPDVLTVYKDSKNGIIFIASLFGILAVIVFALPYIQGYFESFGNKPKTEEKKEDAPKEEEKKEIPKEEEKPKEENIDDTTLSVIQNTLFSTTNLKRLDILNQSVTDFNTLNNDEKLLLAAYNVAEGTELNKDSVEAQFKTLFGDNKTINHGSIMCPGRNYEYLIFDSATNKYRFGNLGCDSFNEPNFVYNIISAKTLDNVYTIEVKKAFTTDDKNLYARINEIGDTTKLLYTHSDEDIAANKTLNQVFNEQYENLKDKLITYRYTLIKTNNNYVLDKFEVLQ